MIGLTLIYAANMGLFASSFWALFSKAGRPGWASFVPIYNGLLFMDIIGKPRWFLLLFFIPFVNIVVGIVAANMLSKSFGKEEGFTVGLVLLSFIFLPILAFGDAKYRHAVEQ